jgi:hypothetical protein
LSQPLSASKTFSRPLMKATLIAVFTALSLGTNYAMIDVPNVKIMDALIFIAGFLFGLEVGVVSAVTTRLVYGFINPYGQASSILPFLCLGECFYAIAGVLLARTSAAKDLMNHGRPYAGMSFLFGMVGLQTTFAFDLLTNFGTYVLTTKSVYQALIIAIITGAPLGILHEVTNLAFFAVVVPPAIVAAKAYSRDVGGRFFGPGARS